MTVVNHIGQCVADLDRSRRFYEALGFTHWYDISPPDTFSAKLLALEPPLGLRCSYLRCGDVVLELLAYDDAGVVDGPTRAMNTRGLTHLSLCVHDIAATCRLVSELGGEVLAGTDVLAAIFVRDPDGQLIELLPMGFRDSLPPLPDASAE
jgi:lactoylglutathione lyase